MFFLLLYFYSCFYYFYYYYYYYCYYLSLLPEPETPVMRCRASKRSARCPFRSEFTTPYE